MHPPVHTPNAISRAGFYDARIFCSQSGSAIKILLYYSMHIVALAREFHCVCFPSKAADMRKKRGAEWLLSAFTMLQTHPPNQNEHLAPRKIY
jgi:hypothetical protein